MTNFNVTNTVADPGRFHVGLQIFLPHQAMLLALVKLTLISCGTGGALAV